MILALNVGRDKFQKILAFVSRLLGVYGLFLSITRKARKKNENFRDSAATEPRVSIIADAREYRKRLHILTIISW